MPSLTSLVGAATAAYAAALVVAPRVLIGPSGLPDDPRTRALVRERCDVVVRIPISRDTESLNVSVAAGIALYHAATLRAAPRPGAVPPSR